jgi:CRISPR-associated protein Cas5h
MNASRPFTIFTIASDMAHFRRQYAITTALTYAIPPRTALCGLVGAVLGLQKNACLQQFGDSEAIFGVQIIDPVRTGHVSINLLDTKDNRDFRPKRVNPHTAMRYEIVRQPRYRVMFSHEELGERLATALQRDESQYTPCLGLAWMIAWFEEVWVATAEYVDDGPKGNKFVSPVRTSDINGEIVWNASGVYQRIRMPAEMQPNRQVTRYEEYIVDLTGNPMEASMRSYWRLSDGTCFSPM